MDKRTVWLDSLKNSISPKDFELLKKASKILTENIRDGEKYPWSPYRCIVPFGDREIPGIWNWDSAFHALGTLKWDISLAKEQILGFIQFQLENGMFIDMIRSDGEKNEISSKPPVMAFYAAEVFKSDNDISFAERVYPALCKNEEFWRKERFYNGLFCYGANINICEFEEVDLYIRYESGWDNSVRWDKPCSDYWPIDLNCFAVMMYRGLITLATALGKTTDAEVFKTRERTLTENILKELWNDELKIYTDKNRFTNENSSILTPANFMPLFIGIAPKENTKKTAELAKDKTKFYPGMPTVSYDDEEYSLDYWRGPTWLNVAYFAAKGLKNYGYNDIAESIKQAVLGWVENDSDDIHENYDSKTGTGLCCPKFSWSCVFVIEFILNF